MVSDSSAYKANAAKDDEEETTMRLCVLDWDDTLCPSSWISSKQQRQPNGDGEVTTSTTEEESEAKLLRNVEEGISALLSCVESLGCSVVVITNADEEWVRFSCARFLPRVVPLLARVHVISARQYEGIYPGRSVCWKAAAFTHVAKAYFAQRQRRGSGRRQMISIGDSNDERLAVKAAASPLNALPKAIKLVDSPRLHTVACQLHTVTQCLESVVRCEHALDLDVSTILNYMHVKARAEEKKFFADDVDSPQLLERVWHDAAWGLLASVRYQSIQQSQQLLHKNDDDDDAPQQQQQQQQQQPSFSTTAPTNTLHPTMANGQSTPATTPWPVPELPAAA